MNNKTNYLVELTNKLIKAIEYLVLCQIKIYGYASYLASIFECSSLAKSSTYSSMPAVLLN